MNLAAGYEAKVVVSFLSFNLYDFSVPYSCIRTLGKDIFVLFYHFFKYLIEEFTVCGV